ncbi:GerAB/ArcD/ProY family transporter [Marinicrinis sediminis]|uniref:GerAB/ArcD/ProY family transporter n=1 Tax=Marinicrinis sediminis TaxID=1652465 RepID=A0ABW5REJ5_9BACL
MNVQVEERFQISPFFVFYLVHAGVIGLGILSYQRSLVQAASYDSWVSILLLGLVMNGVIWMMYRMLNSEQNDLHSLHEWLFGKWIGKGLTLVFSLYLFYASFMILIGYLEIVKVWLFPTLKPWLLQMVILLLVYYILSGGLRMITGICLWGVIIPLAMIGPLLVYPIQFGQWSNLQPILNHSLMEYVHSGKLMIFQYVGFESLFFYFPFIKKGGQSLKWAQWGMISVILLYLVNMFITFVYYSEGLLQHTIWPTLTMITILEVPFIQRFEYIMVSIWLLVVIPNICIYLWSAARGVKRAFNWKMKFTFIPAIILLYLSAIFIKERQMISMMGEILSWMGMVSMAYIAVLYVMVSMKRAWSKKT